MVERCQYPQARNRDRHIETGMLNVQRSWNNGCGSLFSSRLWVIKYTAAYQVSLNNLHYITTCFIIPSDISWAFFSPAEFPDKNLSLITFSPVVQFCCISSKFGISNTFTYVTSVLKDISDVAMVTFARLHCSEGPSPVICEVWPPLT